jgi:hypothetical protein
LQDAPTSVQLPAPATRDIVFVSYARPEDSVFAEWLTLRLQREGYDAWCEVLRLPGGADFWVEIEHLLRTRVRKFLYVLSRTSNAKAGVLKEAGVAASVGKSIGDTRFMIPLKIDDLPTSEHNIDIYRLNALDFHVGWASGFAQLLKTLRNEGVPAANSSGPSTVAKWWNTRRLNKGMLRKESKRHLTNQFLIESLPSSVFAWRIPEDGNVPQSVQWPAHRVQDCYLSFANAIALTGKSGSPTGGR